MFTIFLRFNMISIKPLAIYFFLLFSILAPALASSLPPGSSPGHTAARLKYSRAHYLDDSYTFDPKDGWEPINATYPGGGLETRASAKKASSKKSLFSNFLDIVKGYGKPKPVTITW